MVDVEYVAKTDLSCSSSSYDEHENCSASVRTHNNEDKDLYLIASVGDRNDDGNSDYAEQLKALRNTKCLFE